MVTTKGKFLRNLRVGVGLGLLAAGGALSHPALSEATTPHVAPEQREAPEDTALPPLPSVTLAGAALPAGQTSRAVAERYAERFLTEEMEIRAGEESVRLTREALGLRVDVVALTARLNEAADRDSDLHRLREAYAIDGPIPIEPPIVVDPERAISALQRLERRVYQEPRDATIDLETMQVSEEREGRLLDAWATLARITEACRTGSTEVRAEVRREEPTRRAEDLEGVDISTELGSFETRYSLLEEVSNRTHNLKVAAGRIDGTILMPGEIFDYNEVVGERSQANGFRNATVIAGGELRDGVGGGACQISGTLHAAVFFSGLEILERSPHSRPSTYIKLGLDAMVSYPNINFRFRNDRAFPVMVRMSVEGGTVRAWLEGEEREQMVSFVRRVDSVMPFREIEREDPDLPEGVQVLEQRGVAGFRVTRFRILRDLERNVARRERIRDVYPPTTQIWRVGTGGEIPDDFEPPEGDGHPEYRADEYLIMTQGPETGGTVEQKRAGRTGTVGWTDREGMPSADRPRMPEGWEPPEEDEEE